MSTSSAPPRVVIAEDEAIIRLDLRETLVAQGYEVVGEAGRGDEAVDLVRSLRPDLVILDVKMPGLDGLSAARLIAAERLAAVLVLTAFSQRELVTEARDAGALAYLVKPFQEKDLVPAIEVALARHAELVALERSVDDLQERLAARKLTDRAKGRLMDDHGLDEQTAWRFIQTSAMNGRTSIAAIAQRILDGDQQPGPEASRTPDSGHPPDVRSAAMPKLLLLDGHSLAYRAFYALPTDLSTRGGTITNAVYGFTSMLTKVLADEQPDEIAVVFDSKGPTFRDAMDAEYKAGRKQTPELFSSQMPLIREVLDTIKVPVLEIEGVEADDVIATLATRAAAAGTDVVVVTGDRDAYQLVEDPHLKVLYNRRGVSDYALYDEAGIVERTGVTAKQYPEYAALRGDTSDNLPGVPGIGEKTAAKLVNTYGGLDGIFEHVAAQTPKLRASLAEHEERVRK